MPGAVYESKDGAASWQLVNGSQKFGTCHAFKNGTIRGEPVIFASCDVGVINRPTAGGEWSVIPPGGWGQAGYLTVSDSLKTTSVLGGCVGQYGCSSGRDAGAAHRAAGCIGWSCSS